MEGRLSTHVLNGETDPHEEEKHRKTPSVYVSLSLGRVSLSICPRLSGTSRAASPRRLACDQATE